MTRWGVLSTARINEAVLRGVDGSPAVDVVAVGSRSAEGAEAFARECGIPRAHGSYEELLADPDVEAVYIPLPNGMHVEWTLRALEAGKHVLCEKPLSLRAAEVERCFDAAERHGLVLSEGVHVAPPPADGQAGRARRADRRAAARARDVLVLARPSEDNVRWDAALDGGALSDVGCYCVSAARLFAGEPERVSGEAVMTEAASTRASSATLRLPGDVIASSTAASTCRRATSSRSSGPRGDCSPTTRGTAASR